MPHTFVDQQDSTQVLSVTAHSRNRRGRLVVEVVGEVDHYTSPLLDACLRTQSSRPGLGELVVDMKEVTYLGAAGLSVLAEASMRCRRRGARLLVRCDSRRSVVRPLQLSGMVYLLGLDACASGGMPGPVVERRRRRGPSRRRHTIAGTAADASGNSPVGVSSVKPAGRQPADPAGHLRYQPVRQGC